MQASLGAPEYNAPFQQIVLTAKTLHIKITRLCLAYNLVTACPLGISVAFLARQEGRWHKHHLTPVKAQLIRWVVVSSVMLHGDSMLVISFALTKI